MRPLRATGVAVMLMPTKTVYRVVGEFALENGAMLRFEVSESCAFPEGTVVPESLR